MKQLVGRLAYYTREHDRETNERLRAEFKAEVDRTRAELARREAKRQRAATVKESMAVRQSPHVSNRERNTSTGVRERQPDNAA